MENFPKRRKMDDNPYRLSFDKDLNSYIVVFKDAMNEIQRVAIDSDLYLIFDQFELNDLSILNEYDRHIEHLEQTEESLYHRATQKRVNIEEEVIKDITYQELKKEIVSLPDIQKRRLKMYFFEDLTLKQIAEIEDCSIRAVKYSIDIAIKKLSARIKI